MKKSGQLVQLFRATSPFQTRKRMVTVDVIALYSAYCG